MKDFYMNEIKEIHMKCKICCEMKDVYTKLKFLRFREQKQIFELVFLKLLDELCIASVSHNLPWLFGLYFHLLLNFISAFAF